MWFVWFSASSHTADDIMLQGEVMLYDEMVCSAIDSIYVMQSMCRNSCCQCTMHNVVVGRGRNAWGGRSWEKSQHQDKSYQHSAIVARYGASLTDNHPGLLLPYWQLVLRTYNTVLASTRNIPSSYPRNCYAADDDYANRHIRMKNYDTLCYLWFHVCAWTTFWSTSCHPWGMILISSLLLKENMITISTLTTIVDHSRHIKRSADINDLRGWWWWWFMQERIMHVDGFDIFL